MAFEMGKTKQTDQYGKDDWDIVEAHTFIGGVEKVSEEN